MSNDWELSTKIAEAEIKAMKDNGIIATLKHYPGTPYNEYMDPHIAPFDNETPIDLW